LHNSRLAIDDLGDGWSATVGAAGVYQLIVAATVVRLDDLVVLRYDRGRVLAADHVESIGLAVVDVRLFHRFSGRPGLIVERAARQDFGTGRRRQFEVTGLGVLLQMVHLLLHLLLLLLHRDQVVDALVTAGTKSVLDGRQVPVVNLGRFAVGHESYGHRVQVLVGRLLVWLAQPLVDGRPVVIEVRMWW